MWLIKNKKWLKQAAINIEKNEQGCVLCTHFRRDIEEPLERCDKMLNVIDEHGVLRYTMWIGSPATRNNCLSYEFNEEKLELYKRDIARGGDEPAPSGVTPVYTTMNKKVWLRK